MAETINVNVKQLYNIAYKTLLKIGLTEEEAHAGADVLSMADLRGVHTHGLNRLKIYIKRFEAGVSNKNAKLQIIKETPCSYSFDAQHGLGIVMAPQAMKKVIEKAKKNGMCIGVVRNSGHFGIAGYYSMLAAKEGLIGMTISDTVQIVTPFGGKEPVLGNSPWSLVFPSTREGDDGVMADMACSEVALGKIELALLGGKKMPLTWAMGPDGKPTDDPQVAISNLAMLPFGGPKGYCVALMWEMLTTALSAGHNEKNVYRQAQENENISHFFMAIDPAIFNPIEEINAVANELLDSVKNSAPAAGFSEVMLPGEIEYKKMHANEKNGIDLDMKIAEALLSTLKENNVLHTEATMEDMFNM